MADAANEPLGSVSPPPVDVAAVLPLLQGYLRRLVPTLLEIDESVVDTLLRSGESANLVRTFATDAQSPVLVFIRPAEANDAVSNENRPVIVQVALEVAVKDSRSNAVAFIKRAGLLDPTRPLAAQLHLLNLPEGSPYEILHSYIRNAVAPFFNSYAAKFSTSNESDKDAKSGIPVVKKKMAELELSLLHLHQNIEIPEVNLVIDPVIENAIKKAVATQKKPTVSEIEQKDDSAFLNRLQNGVNGWIKEIHKVTKLERDASTGSAVQEINFWLEMERAIQRVEDQLQSDGVVLTREVLKSAKRLYATMSFDADIGLRECKELVARYNIMMKDFPINELLSAADVDRIRDALTQVFTHLIKKFKQVPYPIPRALLLVEAISRDLNDQLVRVLSIHRLMLLPYAEFERVTSVCLAIFRLWEDNMKEFTEQARNKIKNSKEKYVPLKVNAEHTKLQERIDYLRVFRQQHEQLRSTIARVLRTSAVSNDATAPSDETSLTVLEGGIDPVEEVNQAYASLERVDVLDVSPEGTATWETVELGYNERVARLENAIIALLRDRLAIARNASEMFRVFSRFNALFVRPKIRGAIQEYQASLIKRVEEDIMSLQKKFTAQYTLSQAARMATVRDIPELSGFVIWARQMERQLSTYMARVEDVLGKDWSNYAAGKKLVAEANNFRAALDTKGEFDKWIADITRRDLKVDGPIFAVRANRALGNRLQLVVNFDSKLIDLFKEVRNLNWLNFSIPQKVSSVAKEAKNVYPYAVSLMEAVRTYERANNCIEGNANLELLVAGFRNEIHSLITRGMSMRWDAFARLETRSSAQTDNDRNVAFVRELALKVSQYFEKVNELLSINENIDKAIESLRSCPFKAKAFAEILDGIQKQIDRLNLESLSNLDVWVEKLNDRIQVVLIARLQLAIKVWIYAFNNNAVANRGNDSSDNQSKNARRRDDAAVADAIGADADDELREMALATSPNIPVTVYELRIRNQVMHLDPPIEEARAAWISQLFTWLGIVTTTSRLQSSRYSIGLRRVEKTITETTYHSLLLAILRSGDLSKAYAAIDAKLQDMTTYVNEWLQYQALWDLEASHVYSRLGDDLGRWQQLLGEIRAARNTFDNAETSRSFGPAIVDYGQVQAKVNAKYDTWQKEILSRFGQRLGTAMGDFYGVISRARTELESHSLETESTADAVSFITFVGDLKRKLSAWSNSLEIYRGGQKLLERQRFLFPADWLYFDQVQGEWSSLNEILTLRNAAIQNQIANLQMKIVAEDDAIDRRVRELTAEWDQSKPVAGDLKPDIAVNALTVFEGRIVRLQEEYLQVCRAKEALNLELSQEDRLAPLLEELKDLKGVWSELGRVWQSINELSDTTWSSVVPRKVRTRLDGLLTEIKNLPGRLHQYAAYEYVQNTLKGYLKVNSLMSDLKSDALRERHWKMIFKRLRVEGKFLLQEMTLGNVWELNLTKNETAIKDVILIAQGEMALEEFLKQVRETWQVYELELVAYQTKCRLIKGWDELFGKCGEHLNSLSAMKLSPYFKVFEDEALAWEDKLTRVQVLFDVWIDVQRQWVYLEGIFSGSADIKNLLPTETSRFQSINSEFLALMKKVQKAPLILEVLSIQGVQRSLERLADLLSKIQKALGEYLEKERSAFPRFYFVGDEDLLEIIGNSKDIVKIQKHFKKMFAGLSSLLLNEEANVIEGMASREGEEVRFSTPVSLKDGPKINVWLSALENEMRLTLAKILADSVHDLTPIFNAEETSINTQGYLAWIDKYPAQLVVLTSQILWSEAVEKALQQGQGAAGLAQVLSRLQSILTVLADTVLQELPPIQRKKCEHLITELVHQRDVVRALSRAGVSSNKSFDWLYHMRFYFNTKVEDPLARLSIRMANASFEYGYEYLGLTDKLVQTPLTDRCYLTLTQAMELRLGGSPFGPAGTGKTESVKALGCQLGRFVLVFCCDEAFDFQAMGRIFVGVCQTGQWVCFDEFNRLEERILSAVSQQVQTIQQALKEKQGQSKIEIELVDKTVIVKPTTGIFITMNPGYAGRSNLPDNLKKLFRSMAMTKPDRELIAQVMLYSQGFRTAEILASKVVPFFNLCEEQLSPQPHYDFGLRALKSVLVSAGNLKRDRLKRLQTSGGGPLPDQAEQEIIIQSVAETVVPKLVQDDIPLLKSLLADVFPGVPYVPADLEQLRAEILRVCAQRHLVPDAGWVEKVIQLYQIQNIHHGLMMVGPSGSGKSAAWSVLLAALARTEGTEGVAHVIDPKAMSKDALYGTLDSTTREWTDGLFTNILRKVIDNVRGELGRRQWIIFDGDVDPEWVENLNSVLDDNKLLTLPNGERLGLPTNVRIMFEVQDLRSATLATVSRCGMVWFSDNVVTFPMVAHHYLATLRHVPLDDSTTVEESGKKGTTAEGGATEEAETTPTLRVQRDCAAILSPHFATDGLIEKALVFAEGLEHIMEFTRPRVLNTLFSMLNKSVRSVLDYNDGHSDFPMSIEHLERYISKRLLYSLVWSFSGDARLPLRADLGRFVLSVMNMDLPQSGGDRTLIDYEVQVNSGEWSPWSSRVPVVEIETHKVSAADVVIPTIDTARHEDVLYTWLAEHKPLLLCGPPGSGKTMTLFAALRALPELEVVGLNFSSATTPELILKTFEQYCEYKKTPSGLVLAPTIMSKWLVLFCDEINLPAPDKYGTQRVISFLRQMVERGGFWRVQDKQWVRLSRIQFVGACNPPTDPGRVPLSARFLRHAPLIMVDYPGPDSLKQIYGTFNRALLKLIPALRSFSSALTDAMVSVYLKSQVHFTPDQQAHYIYSPRELTRWVRGIYEAIKPLESLDLNALVRLWAHEGLRLFADRLVTPEERAWTGSLIDSVALESFPTVDSAVALKRPILFSDWLSKNYLPVDQEPLREYIRARLRVFYEEELDVPLVLFNDLLEHVLRIDRVFKQVQGHLLLIGVSGAGKTTLSRFVAWLNGLSVYQIKVHNAYTMEDFDEDLRNLLRRAGTRGEKIAFILDESNILDSGFLERMNTLLANGEVPGLFDGDEYGALLTQCKEGAQREGLMLDSADELYKWFTSQVMRNLHVVFTMNPPEGGLGGKAATSPALFNRCVLDWFGDWSQQAYFQVGKEFTDKLDLDVANYHYPDFFPVAYTDLPQPPTHRDAIVNAFVFIHKSLEDVNARVVKRTGRVNHITPRHYLDFIQHYVRLFQNKREQLEEQQLHLNVGLQKLRDTFESVELLQKSLAVKTAELEKKNAEANEKLRSMVKEQQEAESKKKASEQLQDAVARQNAAILERKRVVELDLSKAEPAVREAEQSVKNIKTQHLVEVRGMANPPALVKLALEGVCVLLGEKADSWKTIQGILRRPDFIASIVNYDTDARMTEAMRKEMRTTFLNNPDFTFEKVDRASKACGPLVQWAIAQVSFSEILHKVEPLRNEVASLEKDATETRLKAQELINMINELEASIARYKEEYAVLIAETQRLKGEMETVRTKVERATRLLSSLSSERDRWAATSATFEAQMGTIVGDVLISAAFLSYAGYYDQQYRQMLLTRWTAHLQAANIQLKTELSITEYLSNADERLAWQANALPVDDLATENAILLKRFNRYPLIIDPSGQATTFLLNEYKDRKITRTSFLDKSFLKTLESALRFGNPLLVEDVEALDPILNPLLNRELRKTGGRVLVRLGAQDIDFSPQFTLFLSTRDSSAAFPPDLCSRVTFVNFTVTRASLQSQCLNQVLKAERADTDQQRTDLLRAQGEFQLRLRQLERSLLDALNASQGNLLDNDTVITNLEALKREAFDISQRMAATETVAAEVDAVTRQYTPLASACSAVYFVMEALNQLHPFYQYSLDFFYTIFEYVLHKNPALSGIKDPLQRLNVLNKDLFSVSFRRISRGLLHEDHVTLALLLGQIFINDVADRPDEAEWNFWLSGGGTTAKAEQTISASHPLFKDLDDEQKERLAAFSSLKILHGLVQHMTEHVDEWRAFLASPTPERVVPRCFESADHSIDSVVNVFRRGLVVKCLRPDRVVPASTLLAEAIFGKGVLSVQPSDVTLLKTVVQTEIQSNTPLALCSVPGLDASFTVDALARETANVNMVSVAIGSAEGFTLADQAISEASKNGSWVLLKNVHLAPSWLVQLEKKLHALRSHPNFRLFLTMEINPAVPPAVLRLSRIFIYERAPGLKANLIESLGAIPKEDTERAPVERSRLLFLVAWLHAVLQERLRYAPLGWTKVYEFNDADRRCAMDVINSWIDQAGAGRNNISPDKIPWDALKTLLSQSIYGGRVDNDFDQRTLDSFVAALFTPKAYEANFALVPGQLGAASKQASSSEADDSEARIDENDPVLIPEGTSLAHFLLWAQSLPDRQSPAWLGLPANAEKVLLISQGNSLLSKLRAMKSLTVEEESVASVLPTDQASTRNKKAKSAPVSSQDAASAQPAWMIALAATAAEYAKLLPSTLSTLAQSSTDALRNPITRVFVRETSNGASLLKKVRRDLADLQACCEGRLKQTNHLRSLMNDVNKGMIPKHWRTYKVPNGVPLSQWIADFALRIQLLESLAAPQPPTTLWLGGLLAPEAYITATRQAVAQSNQWSLEELSLRLEIAQNESPEKDTFLLSGLRLEGATWEQGTIQPSKIMSTRLPTLRLRWVRQNGETITKTSGDVTLPVYLNAARSHLLFTVKLEVSDLDDKGAYQRGVALVASSLKGF